jgi:hypothetical protein
MKLKTDILRPGSWQAFVMITATVSGEALEKTEGACNASTP